jgi:hypothetical protein
MEHVNIGFGKFLLGVNRKAGNIPTMSELGRFPLGINIIGKINSYWSHLNNTTNPILKDQDAYEESRFCIQMATILGSPSIRLCLNILCLNETT